MKKIFKLLLIIFLISINVFNLKADCESDKLDIENILFENYNYIDNDDFVETINISSYNENYYAVFSNDYNEEKPTINLENGLIAYTLKYKDKVVTVKANIYSKNCGSEVLKEYEVVGAKLNKYSELDVCKEIIGASSLCNPQTDTSDMTEQDFIKEVKKDNRDTKIQLFIKKDLKRYVLYAAIPFVVAAIGFIIAVIVLKHKRKQVYKKGVK